MVNSSILGSGFVVMATDQTMARVQRHSKMGRTNCIMASREITRGPVATHVSRNVADLRRKRGMSLAQLSEVMTDFAGRPILASGLGKIETGERRVDVDDLVALAMALDVSPVRLLLPRPQAEASGGQEELVEDPLHRGPGPNDYVLPSGGHTPLAKVWSWACGDEPLWGFDRAGDWDEENRPPEGRHISVMALERLAESARDTGRALHQAAVALQQAANSEAQGRRGDPPASQAADVHAQEPARG